MINITVTLLGHNFSRDLKGNVNHLDISSFSSPIERESIQLFDTFFFNCSDQKLWYLTALGKNKKNTMPVFYINELFISPASIKEHWIVACSVFVFNHSSGKARRLTFVECNNDINTMIDLAKVADLVSSVKSICLLHGFSLMKSLP